MIALTVPHEVSKLLSKIKVPGDKTPLEEYHITLFSLNDNMKLEDIEKVIEPVYELAKKTEPFKITLKEFTTFEGNDKIPVICRLDTEEIFKFRESLRKKLDKAGIEYSKKFPEFKPHITLSYHKEKVKDKSVDKISFEVDSVAIYGGDSGKEKIYIECKFGKNIKKRSSEYLLKECERFYKIANL